MSDVDKSIAWEFSIKMLLARQSIEEKGFVHIQSSLMRQLLLNFGAREEDLIKMENGEIHDDMPEDSLSTMIHRTIACMILHILDICETIILKFCKLW